MTDASEGGTPRVKRTIDGTLFLVGGSNSVLDLFAADIFRRRIDVMRWKECINLRQTRLAEMGVRYRMLIVPEKLSVTGMIEPYRSDLFTRDEALTPPGLRFAETIGNGAIIYPLNFLRRQILQGYNVFPKTDSHWSGTGALSAFQYLTVSMDYKFDFSSFLALGRRTLRYRGDLWEEQFTDVEAENFVKLEVPPWIHRVYANSIVGFKEKNNLSNSPGLHAGSHCIFANDKPASGDSVIIFGSSFSDYRLTVNQLTAVFSAHFKYVHFVWSTEVDFDYISRIKPNLVITEIPERFLTNCPRDELNIEAYAIARLDRWKREQSVS